MTATTASRVINQLRVRAGRAPDADPQLPASLATSLVLEKGMALLRGICRTRQPVFLEPRVRMRGKSRIAFGRGLSIGRGTYLDGYCTSGVHLGRSSRLGSYCVVTCTSHVNRIGRGFELGENSGLGDFCHVGASGGVMIGRDVIMGSYVSFHSQEHVFSDPGIPIRLQGTTEQGIRVGDGCWLGARVTVLDGSDIGAGSIVAAGAVVRGAFPPRSLIAGVPARVIRPLDE